MKVGKVLDSGKNKSRRGLLLGLAGLSAVAWGWQRFGVREAALKFQPIPDLPGWRLAETGAVSGGGATDAVFLGIGDETSKPLAPEILCETLYSRPGPGVAVAVFTDINCPNCRSLEAKLAARTDGLTLTWLQLPRLGPGSVVAARVAVAASLLGGVPPSPPGALRGTGVASLVRFHAARARIAPEALEAEVDSLRVTEILEIHAGAAETLGVWGTPAMTIGKTLVMGDMSEDRLDQLLEMEHPACG